MRAAISEAPAVQLAASAARVILTALVVLWASGRQTIVAGVRAPP